MKQPLVPVVLCYGAGVVLGRFVEAPWLTTLLAAFGVTLAGLGLARVRFPLLACGVFLFGWASLTCRTASISPHDLRLVLPDAARIITVRGRINDDPSQRVFTRQGRETSHTLTEIEVEAVRAGQGEWQQASGRLMSRTAGALTPEHFRGRAVEIKGVAMKPGPPIAEGLFDYARHLELRGIHFEFDVEAPGDWRFQDGTPSRPVPERFRAWAQHTLARGMPAEDESLRLQWAMLLGWQTALTAEVSEPFMRSGTMHIFAISGLHIALIAGIFLALLRAVALPRLACGLVVIPVLWFYTAATGWQASAIRSTVMMSVIITGWSLKRPSDLLNSLAVAAALILVWQPEQLFQAGFQLSFFVVLSIALLSPPIERMRSRLFALDPWLPYELRPGWQRLLIWRGLDVWKAFATSIAAFIGSIPLMAHYFHLFTPGSLLANVVIVPASALALMSGLGALLTGDLAPGLTELFNHSGWFWMRAMVWLSEHAAALPGSWCHVEAPGPWLFFLYYGLLIAGCLGWFSRERIRWIAVAGLGCCAGMWLVNWHEQQQWHRLTVLPLNATHAVYLKPARAGAKWLVDCGSRSSASITLKPFLQSRGINRLDYLLLTQASSSRTGGALELPLFLRLGTTIVSPLPSRSPVHAATLKNLEQHSRLQRDATNGMEFPPVRVLHPEPADRFARAEDGAVVALVEIERARVLLIPDLSRLGQNAVALRHPDLRADIVVAGASDQPPAAEWIESLRPKLIILADTEARPVDRSNADWLARLRRSGARVVTTSRAGAVTVSFRDKSWQAQSARRIIGLESARETAGRGVPGG